MSARGIGLAAAAMAFALDQGSKTLAINSSTLEQGVEVLPVLNLVAVRNDGVSFGMLGGLAPWWALVGFALGIMAALLVWLWRTQSLLLGAALGLILGGALGNVLDRLRHGGVTDFLDFHFAGYHWPAFNLADSAIFLGVALLLSAEWRTRAVESDRPSPRARGR